MYRTENLISPSNPVKLIKADKIAVLPGELDSEVFARSIDGQSLCGTHLGTAVITVVGAVAFEDLRGEVLLQRHLQGVPAANNNESVRRGGHRDVAAQPASDALPEFGEQRPFDVLEDPGHF